MNILTCVVVPIYKDFINLTYEESISLKQCFNVLRTFDIVFVGPIHLNFDPYLNFTKNCCSNIYVKKFDSFYFLNIDGYNQLLLNVTFYKSFLDYKYILIHQLDAYVFRDELEYWCAMGYDYIGAPWISIENVPIVGVGNGGLSLRNVKNTLSLIKKLRLLEVLKLYQNFNTLDTFVRLPLLIKKLFNSIGLPSSFEQNYKLNEDFFWGIAAHQELNNFTCNSFLLKHIASYLLKNNFRVPLVELALQFSFETNPRMLYKMNNNKLPFGCHAWEKYDPEFWKTYIS